MDPTWVASLLAGRVTRIVMCGVAGVCAYLTGQGILVPTPDQSVVQPIVTALLTAALVVASAWWSKKKDAMLATTNPATFAAPKP